MSTRYVVFFATLVCIFSLRRRSLTAAEVLETTVAHNRATNPQLISTLRSSYNLHRSHDLTLRVLQSAGNITDRQTENIAAAYLKCYSLLDEATSVTNGSMGQEEFVSFLMEMTDGDLSFGRFADLPALFVMIFYTAACHTGSDCIPGNRPQFEIGDTSNPNEESQFLCQQTLKSTFSKAESVFEYFIRYSTDVIDEGDLATCLSTATVNVLLEDLASCPVLAEVDLTERKKQRRNALLRNAPTYVQSKDRQQQRRLQSLGSAGTTDDSMCDYDILVTVDRFTELRKFPRPVFVNYFPLTISSPLRCCSM
jgi:hypothetical protein